MQRFRPDDNVISEAGGTTAERGRRRVPGGLTTALAAVSLATALAVPLGTAAATAASAASPPPPAAGVTPGAVASDASHQYLFYTAGDGSVWAQNVASGGTTPLAVGGNLVSAPSPVIPSGVLFVFGQGTDNQLWSNSCDLSLNGCGSWVSLGGQITSKPGAVSPGSASYSVYARGTDGAVWARDYTNYSGLGPWHSLGGQVLAGTGPTAAYLNGSTYVMTVGTDHQLYIEQVGVTGFVPAGGQTNASPALTAVPAANGQPAALVGFARGTDGHGYYHRFASSSPGWQFMNGTFSSGLAAAEAVQPGIPTTYTFGLGQVPQVFEQTATWATYPPGGIGTWVPVTS